MANHLWLWKSKLFFGWFASSAYWRQHRCSASIPFQLKEKHQR